MAKPFSKTFRTGWSEANAVGEVHVSHYLRYVVETAWDWGATVGLSIAESGELGLAWVLRETEINLYRPLHPHDIFELSIWLVEWRRVHGTRCFEITLKDSGELVAQGTQEVVSLDLKTMRPVATPDDIIDKLRTEDPRVLQHQRFPRLQFGSDNAFEMRRAVHWQDLDAQEQVNNANYADYAEDAATEALAALGWTPERFKGAGLAMVGRRIHLQYLASATWGETLQVVTHLAGLKRTGGAWYVEIARTSDRAPIAACVIDWSLARRSSGEALDLPMGLQRALEERFAVSLTDPGLPSK
jgi:YbgC/YbaW family acyl-CoA thioester hydrolase